MNKKRFSAILLAGLMTASLAAVSANAADTDYIYGTMNIPYADFYAQEGVASEVDVVASATTAGKWKNENLVAGTYNEENGDETGTILGVTYPVALTAETLAALGEDNYGFVETDEVPAAYKIVTADNGSVSFSEVQGDTTAIEGVSATVSTARVWGDYQITVDAINNSEGTSDVGRIYGVLIDTKEGDRYALRHLENIWRDSLAWSTGITKEEAHGNVLSYENYVGSMGETVSQITYITETGYHTLSTELYLPVKFENTLTVSDADITAGSTGFEMTGFPEDYDLTYAVDGLDCTVSDGSITYTDALPGSYTLTVSDASGVYADVTASFILSTDAMPAAYADGKLVAADGVDGFDNFLKNLATVSVNGTDYAASGKRSVAIIGQDGSIDMDAAQGETAVFDGADSYEIVVSATGYTQTLTFTLGEETVEDTPNTGVGSAAVPAVIGVAGVAALLAILKKKKAE
jgi:hypothetical protein